MSQNIPILFIVFNRFKEARLVFESIKEHKPQKLFISSDGPRNVEESEKVFFIRKYILENINWECEITTKFNDLNLGCNKGPSSAISWFFSQVPYGIILEDDCVPNKTFFDFCNKYLELYKDDKRVWHIAGCNLLGKTRHNLIRSDITFTKYTFVWGWASWADRWINYDSDLSTFNSENFIIEKFKNSKDQQYWIDIFKKVKNKEFLSCWDYQWTFMCWKHNALSIVPNENLIKNIGFTNEATHTSNPNPFLENLKVYSWKNFNSDISEPILNTKYDGKVQRNIFRHHLWIKIVLKIFKIIKSNNKKKY